MEILAILLSSLMGLLSPAGLIVDHVAQQAIRQRLTAAEQLQVRIDNAPSYQILQGRVQRVRVAGRGLFPIPGVRIAALEVETDAIALRPSSLRRRTPKFEEPLQAGIRLVLTREDINKALQSPRVAERLRDLSLNLLGSSSSRQSRRYDLINPQVTFLENNRVRLQVTIQTEQTNDQLPITVESGVNIVSGHRLQLTDPNIIVGDRTLPDLLSRQLAEGISRRFDLQRLEASGITARVLQLQIDPNQMAIAAFVRINPNSTSSGN
jgi:hypothetical protein